VRLLPALGYTGVRIVHLNEGHAALAALELLRERAAASGRWDPDQVRSRCAFTTHTPVPAGHDRFDYALAERLLAPLAPREVLEDLGGSGRLNMTLLALNLSHRVNGVAARHEEISETLFPGRDFGHVTNGVHSVTWTCEPLRQLYDRHIPRWREDPSMLRHTMSLPRDELWAAHQQAKGALLRRVRDATGRELSPEVLTFGFARRSTDYKRADLIFHDVERLRGIARGRLQLVFAGKAHPGDDGGKQLIRHIFEVGHALGQDVPVIYLADYDVELARLLVSGADVWLNTPLRPFEASGTSGMKAAHNAVPSFSVMDGWWVEGCVEGVTGWAIGTGEPETSRQTADGADADDLYRKLAEVVLPLFRDGRDRWLDVMRSTVALNASFFNAHRMVQQYVTSSWLAEEEEEETSTR
jgi:starch phosphorylase